MALIVDQSLCFSCGADKPFALDAQPDKVPPGAGRVKEVEQEESGARQESDADSESVCPLCISRLFSLTAELEYAPLPQLSFQRVIPFSRELDNPASVFHPPRV